MAISRKHLFRMRHWPRPLERVRRALHHGDRPWSFLLIGTSLAVLGLMAAIGWMLWEQSALARERFGWDFLLPSASTSWNPVFERFQSWPFIYGTLVTSFVALACAVPFSVGIAIFLAELAPELVRVPLTWMIELLAAIPSVVYGLWGIFVFLPVVVMPLGRFLEVMLGQMPLIGVFLQGPMPASGASRLAAGLVLAIMITPTIAAVSRDVFLSIPRAQREASLALGATQWETIWQVLIPYGISGILGAVILGLGRALGETMAVTMVIGNSIEGSLSLLRPGYTMSSIIANEFAEAVSQMHTQALIEIGFILFVMTLALNVAARFLVWRVAQRPSQEIL